VTEDDDFAWGDGSFAKLYGDRLADSSLMECAVATRWAFVVMLSRADSEGRFRCATVAGLSRAAAISMEEADLAIKELEAPDDTSTSGEAEGRRIVRIPGGWQLVNYVKYRDYRTRRQIEDAKRQEEHRSRRRDTSRDTSDTSRDVTVRSTPDVRCQMLDVRSKNEQEHLAGGRALPDDSPASQPASEDQEPVECERPAGVVREHALKILTELAELTGLPPDQLVREVSRTSRGQMLDGPEQLRKAPIAWVRVTAEKLAARLFDARAEAKRAPPEPQDWQLENIRRRREESYRKPQTERQSEATT